MPATVWSDTRPDDGARPWSRRLRPSHLNRRHAGNGALRAGAVVAGERHEGKGRGDAVRLSTGISSKGSNPALRGSIVARRPSGRTPGVETRWTPGSVAGCNKPATREAEETVEVV